MHKKVALLAIGTALAAMACGGASTPAAPSRPAGGAQAAGGLFTVNAAPGSALASGDMSRCFQFRSEPACFSGARLKSTIVAGAAAPGAPGNFTATANGSTVTLTWTAPTTGDPVTSYIIEAGSGSGTANLANFSTGSTQTTFTTSGVPNGAYYVRVRASNATGTSAASNEAVLIVGPVCSVAPGEPTALTVSPGISGTATLTFSWGVPAYIPTTYIIEAGSASGLANLASSDLASAATTFTATGVGRGIFYVRVRGKNACGVGLPSNEVIVGVGTVLLDATATINPGLTCQTSGVSRDFNGTAGQTVVINVTGPANSQTAIVLYAPDFATQVAGEGGAKGTSSVKYTLTQTGTYHASMCDDLGVGGSYRMVVTGF